MLENRIIQQPRIEVGTQNGRETFWFSAVDTPGNRVILRLVAQRWANDPDIWFTQHDADRVKEVIG